MIEPKCAGERRLGALVAASTGVHSCRLPDGSVIAVEQSQVHHLLNRANERLGLDIGDPTYTVAEVLELIDSWSLLFVVKRALLQKDDNLTYVFDPGEGGPTHLLAVGVESKRRDSRSHEVVHQHTPADRSHRQNPPNEPPCSQCGGSHHRVIKTVHPLDNAWKKRFVLGLPSARGTFDPMTDAEWFSTLPAAWLLSTNGPHVRLERNTVAAPIVWEDPSVTPELRAAGSVRIYQLPPSIAALVADSFADAHRDGRLFEE